MLVIFVTTHGNCIIDVKVIPKHIHFATFKHSSDAGALGLYAKLFLRHSPPFSYVHN